MATIQTSYGSPEESSKVNQFFTSCSINLNNKYFRL